MLNLKKILVVLIYIIIVTTAIADNRTEASNQLVSAINHVFLVESNYYYYLMSEVYSNGTLIDRYINEVQMRNQLYYKVTTYNNSGEKTLEEISDGEMVAIIDYDKELVMEMDAQSFNAEDIDYVAPIEEMLETFKIISIEETSVGLIPCWDVKFYNVEQNDGAVFEIILAKNIDRIYQLSSINGEISEYIFKFIKFDEARAFNDSVFVINIPSDFIIINGEDADEIED